MAKNLEITSTVTITGTTSDELTLNRQRIPLAVVTPGTLTSTAFTFQGSVDGSSFFPLYLESTLYSITVGTSRFIALDRRAFEACKFIKIIAGSSEGSPRVVGVITGD